jgi:hypothetical protein
MSGVDPADLAPPDENSGNPNDSSEDQITLVEPEFGSALYFKVARTYRLIVA